MLLLLLSCWIITGIMANRPSTTHYAWKNSSVCLHVQKPPPYIRGEWKFAKKVIVYDNTTTPNFKKKVVYSPGNLSLCINELTDTDTGIYEVSFMDSEYDAILEKHQVIVEEIVPKPVMIMSVLQSNLSAGFCNITVNCSIQDDWLWSFCEEDGCRTSQESFSKVNITINIHNRSVICRANNHVSRNDASESIAMCYRTFEPEDKEEFPQLLQIGLISAPCALLVFCIIISAACCLHRARTRNPRTIQSQPVEAPPQSGPRVSTSSSSQAEASYENVEVTQPNQTSSPREELDSKQNNQVDTIYSILQMPNAAACLGKSDSSSNTKGHKNQQEALTSESVALDEAQCSMQVDTVYSVLQKPKL